MEIAVSTLTDQLEEGNYNSQEFKTTKKAIKKDGAAKVLAPLITFMATAINQQQLAQANLLFDDDDIVVRLENNVINLPYQNVGPLKKMLAPEETLPVNVYSIIESPEVNVSSLRIDKVASAADFIAHEAEMAGGIASWLDEKLADIDNHEANTKEAKQPKKD